MSQVPLTPRWAGVLQDRTDQVVASVDTQRANLNWVQPLSFLGPTSATTVKGETVTWGYTTRGSLRSVTRTGTAGTRTATATFVNAGGLWTEATTFADGADKVYLTKTRDAFGAVVESSAFDDVNLRFQEDVLRGPTGRITAERRTSTLLDARARGYQYDALRRLQVVNIDTSTTLTRTNFLAQRNAALASEATGLGVVSSPNAQVRPTLTQADFLTAANSDHLNRAYVATGTSTAAGVPPATVNNLATTQDTRDRISTDGTLTYTWDVFDRLVLVMRGSLEEMRISYDGLGRRRLEKRLVTKPGSAQATEDAILEYVGGNVIEESVLGASTILLSVTHGPGLDAPIFVGNGPTAAATETWVIGTTARGDAATAINATTLAVTEEAYLDPWGERESIVTVGSVCFEGNEATIAGVGASRPSAACATQSKVLQRFGIAGARLHARTKLADMRNRVYATHLRAFLTKDPLGNVDSEGLWNYVAADPVNLRDPMGLDAKPVTPTPEPASTPSASAPEPPPCEGDDCAPMEVTSDSATTRRPKPPEATVLELVASALTGGKAPDVRPSDTPAVDLGGVVRAIAGFAAGIGDVVQGAAASMTPMTYAESSLAFASAAVAFGADVRERGFQGTARARVRGVKDQVSASISSSIRSEFALGRAVPTLVVALAGGGAGLRSAVAGGVERASIVRYDAKRKGHIFRDSDGHVNPSTNSSRLRFARLFERVGSNPKFLRTDAVEANLITPHGAKAGLQAFTWSTMRGQVWVTVRDGLIQHAGVNAVGRFR